MRSFATILIIVLTWASVPALAAPACLHFEPAVSSISGMLVRKTYPGPPNYEDIKKGDRPETGWYVRLAQPVCFVGTPGDEINGEDEAGVNLVQLVLMHNEYKTHTRLVGKNVKATGMFFRAHTGHHYTPVLLTVTSLELSEK
ncbi:MAG: DUF4431 domain-containing protein [Thermoanaerobaculia bacterium]